MNIAKIIAEAHDIAVKDTDDDWSICSLHEEIGKKVLTAFLANAIAGTGEVNQIKEISTQGLTKDRPHECKPVGKIQINAFNMIPQYYVAIGANPESGAICQSLLFSGEKAEQVYAEGFLGCNVSFLMEVTLRTIKITQKGVNS